MRGSAHHSSALDYFCLLSRVPGIFPGIAPAGFRLTRIAGPVKSSVQHWTCSKEADADRVKVVQPPGGRQRQLPISVSPTWKKLCLKCNPGDGKRSHKSAGRLRRGVRPWKNKSRNGFDAG